MEKREPPTLLVGKSMDFILIVAGRLLEGMGHWLVLSVISAIVFAYWRDITPQASRRLLWQR